MTEAERKIRKIKELLASVEEGIRECRAILKGETDQ